MISLRQCLRSLTSTSKLKAKCPQVQGSNEAEMTEAGGGDLEGPGFSPPPEKCQEAMEPSGAKASNFSNESGGFSETTYFKMLAYIKKHSWFTKMLFSDLHAPTCLWRRLQGWWRASWVVCSRGNFLMPAWSTLPQPFHRLCKP